MAEQPALPAWHAERYRRLSEPRPSLVTLIEATTPDTRDRAVDALRALAILGVVLGHWLVTALVNTGGVLHTASPLATMPALTPISWLFQTLAIFFLIGGYTAARGHPRTTDSHPQERDSYRTWFTRRLIRLIAPVPALLAVWLAAVPLLVLAGYPGRTIVALINLVLAPLWFLLVFIGLTALTPLVVRAVRRWGVWSTAAPIAITALVDLARFGLGAPQAIGWLTVASAWLVPFTLGVAWSQGSFTPRRPTPPRAATSPPDSSRHVAGPPTTSSDGGSRRVRSPQGEGGSRSSECLVRGVEGGSWGSALLAWARGRLGSLGLLVGGSAATIALVVFGGYPASMVGVPGQAVSNLSPPTLASVAFGLAQCGGALLLRGPLTRLMRRPVAWAGVALVNLSAMTVFLWHQSALLAVSALVTRITSTVPGLLDAPDHPGWVLHRLVWIPVFGAVLAGLWSLARRFEQRVRVQPISRPGHLIKGTDGPEGALGTRKTTTGCSEH
ncbi:acyltransferase family protein [Actinomadura harenae]|uniref:Acyltransferase n=1 Tax=Actinomadura harenae TaxID=2483351 RepID=A0A3M2MA72_9ACTN|nr:acyltransferase [Actinomadura harenae]RMI46381.1 acyltransferase [Actinomadura harenae]